MFSKGNFILRGAGGTIRIPRYAGSRNSARGAKVAHEAIDRMIPTNPCPPLPRFLGADLVFAFICNSSFWRVSNFGSPWSGVSSLYSK